MTASPGEHDRPSRPTILRDLLVFQVKLWLEGFKDLALVPLSIGAAVIDILFRKSTGQGTLYALMRVGDRFERWVNLYGALERRRERDSLFPVSFLDPEGRRQPTEQKASADEETPEESSSAS